MIVYFFFGKYVLFSFILNKINKAIVFFCCKSKNNDVGASNTNAKKSTKNPKKKLKNQFYSIAQQIE